MLSPSLEEEQQENQEEVIQHNEFGYEEMPQSIIDYVLEQIISRYGTKLNYNIMNEDRLEVLSRANELSLRVSVDLLQKVDDLAKRAKAIIDMFGRTSLIKVDCCITISSTMTRECNWPAE
jgi:Holliday junction resolvasome RuvABC ATP-dependent DNA helicase subunit